MYDEDIAMKEVKNYLRNARDRDGGRSKRTKKNQ